MEPRFAELLPEVLLGIDPAGLAALAARALAPKTDVPEGVSLAHLHAPAVTVREQAVVIVDRLRRQRSTTFRALVPDSPDTVTTVCRFLALLELFREAAVTFDQVTPLGELTIRWTGSDEGEIDVCDEFDEETKPESEDGEAPEVSDETPFLEPGESRTEEDDAEPPSRPKPQRDGEPVTEPTPTHAGHHRDPAADPAERRQPSTTAQTRAARPRPDGPDARARRHAATAAETRDPDTGSAARRPTSAARITPPESGSEPPRQPVLAEDDGGGFVRRRRRTGAEVRAWRGSRTICRRGRPRCRSGTRW